MAKQGNIIFNGAKLEKHEYDVIAFLAEKGFDIEVIPPSYTKGQHTPDILLGGIEWEIKSPNGRNIKSIERNLKRGLKQSKNIILDLSRLKLRTEDCLNMVKRQYANHRSIKQIKVITASGEILDFRRRV